MFTEKVRVRSITISTHSIKKDYFVRIIAHKPRKWKIKDICFSKDFLAFSSISYYPKI